MFKECRHVLPSGKKCQAPALNNGTYCHFHQNARERKDAPRPREGAPFQLPIIEDTHSALIAANEVLQAMSQGRIKRSEGGTYFYGIQLAARFVVRIEQIPLPALRILNVRTLTYDDYGQELAPEKIYCEPPEDCVPCTRRQGCPRYDLWQEEVDELEEQLAEPEEEEEEQEDHEPEENQDQEEDEEQDQEENLEQEEQDQDEIEDEVEEEQKEEAVPSSKPHHPRPSTLKILQARACPDAYPRPLL